jgi:hypothetical protein
MAVRIVALLIPLAITLPQLQTSRPTAAAPDVQALHVQPASPPEWSYETLRLGDAALTRVVLESPLHDAMSTIRDAPSGAAEPAAAPPAVRTAPAQGAVPKPTRLASPAKAPGTVAASMRPSSRQAKLPPVQAGCEPFAHCAPVVVAKAKPVSRRSL